MIYRRIVLTALLIIIGVSFLMAESNFSEEKKEVSLSLIKELFANKNRTEEENEKLLALIEESNAPGREEVKKYILPDQYFLSSDIVKIYTDLANNGDGDAAYLLGMFYHYIENDEIAFDWFEKGSELNNMGCVYEIGILFVYFNHEPTQVKVLPYLKRLLQEAENGNEEAIKYADKVPDDIKEELLEKNNE